MGIKEEIREAKETARKMHETGDTLLKIAEHLNLKHDGFYYVSHGGLYRENVPEAAYPRALICEGMQHA